MPSSKMTTFEYFCTVAPATTAHYPCPPKYCGTHPLWYEPRQHVSFRARAMIWVDTENVCTWDRTVGRRVFAGINCSRHGRRCDDRQHRNATNAVKTARTKKQNATAEAHRRRSRPPRDGRPLAASAVHATRSPPGRVRRRFLLLGSRRTTHLASRLRGRGRGRRGKLREGYLFAVPYLKE